MGPDWFRANRRLGAMSHVIAGKPGYVKFTAARSQFNGRRSGLAMAPDEGGPPNGPYSWAFQLSGGKFPVFCLSPHEVPGVPALMGNAQRKGARPTERILHAGFLLKKVRLDVRRLPQYPLCSFQHACAAASQSCRVLRRARRKKGKKRKEILKDGDWSCLFSEQKHSPVASLDPRDGGFSGLDIDACG